MNDFDPQAAGIGRVDAVREGPAVDPGGPAPGRVGAHVVLELFDKPVFTDDDRRLVAAAAEIGAELLRQALAERQTQRLLFDAVQAALTSSENVARTLAYAPESRPEEPPPQAVLDRLRQGLAADPNAVTDADTGLGLVEAVRVLAVRHGPEAVRHCVTMVEDLRKLLDGITGTE